MNPRHGRHDAEAFQRAWESGGSSSDEVARLVRAAEALCEAAVVAPSPEFRGALRERLMAEAQTVLVPAPGAAREAAPAVSTPQRTASRGRRRLAGVAAAAVSSLGVVGLVAGSASALPGEVLYPVKRGVENVELALQRTAEDRGDQRLAIAAERLEEARTLVAEGSPSERAQVPALLDEFAGQAEQGSSELFDAFGTDGSAATIDSVNDFAAESAVELSSMSSDVPAEASEAFTAAAAVVTDLAGQAARLCGTCGTADVESLLATVGKAVAPPVTTPASAKTDTPKKDRADTDDAPAPVAVAPAPAPTTGTVVPSLPAPTVKTPSKGLRAVTDPVVGGLLGDDEQEGLVPGLLNGLLGGS